MTNTTRCIKRQVNTDGIYNAYGAIRVNMLKPSTTYHIISDYSEWNGSTIFLYLAKQEADGSYTSLSTLIDQNQANTNGKSFSTSSTKRNYAIRALSASRDGIMVESNLQKLDINVKISSSKIKSELNFKHIPTAILDSVEKFYKEKNAR